jgi:signal transduction histidine kinase
MGGSRFASPERACKEDLRRHSGYFASDRIVRPLLDAVPTILAILNPQRQMVYANKALIDLLEVRQEALILGQRPGEALGCLHSSENEGGCGTSEPCSTCGAVLAILAGLNGKSEVRECRMTRKIGKRVENLDLLIWTTPFAYAGEQFTVFAVTDISHEKRRQALERIFFHDILNVAGSVRGFAELLKKYQPENREEIYDLLFQAAEQIIDEIQGQRTLVAAENGELKVSVDEVRSRSLLERLADVYHRSETVRERRVFLAAESQEISFFSDRALLGRVIGNMVKNALEACGPEGEVTLGCRKRGRFVEFWVHNPGLIPHEARLQIFNRSFSTKGQGRGLGTYSMKLLSEYLGGKVFFVSTEEEGTFFYACYPLQVHLTGR